MRRRSQVRRHGWAALTGAALLTLATGCKPACPQSDDARDVTRWAAQLRARQPLALDPRAAISIKRDVRDVIVDVEASRLAAAFAAVMNDPERRFGLIRVDRLPENAGRPFQVGDKFQGRYELEAAARAELRGKLAQWFGDFAESEPVERFMCAVENRHTSNFGVIAELELSPPPGQEYVLEYAYLSGSPIAGSSRFTISEVTEPALLTRHGVAHAARLRQVFEYQEQDGAFAHFFTRGGLRLHNQVVHSQAAQSAELAGGRILESSIPDEYRAW